MKSSNQHREFFSQKFFDLHVMNGDLFTEEENALLRRYGTWMQALDEQNIEPETQEQIAFVEMCRGVKAPTTIFEHAWRKLKERRQFERECICPNPENNRKAMRTTLGQPVATQNGHGENPAGNPGDRHQEQDGAQEQRDGGVCPGFRKNAQEVAKLMERLRAFDNLTSSAQNEITEVFSRDPKIRARLEAFARLPGGQSMERLHKIIVAFINAIPFANAININLYTSALIHHSAITGNPVIANLAQVINDENVVKDIEHRFP